MSQGKTTAESGTGPATSPSTSTPECECRGTGYVVREFAGGVKQTELCACAARRRDERMAECVPLRYRTAHLTHFPEVLVTGVLAWLDLLVSREWQKGRDGLFIGGPHGSGKTHLAAAILIAWRRLNKRGLWRPATELYGLVRESYALRIEHSEREILREHAEVPLLVLDDLGAAGLSDHERRVTLEVLDRRMNELRPTVVTSNWSVAELGARMDDRVGSRLSAYTTVTLRGADQRVR